jgi:hypothetical protein
LKDFAISPSFNMPIMEIPDDKGEAATTRYMSRKWKVLVGAILVGIILVGCAVMVNLPKMGSCDEVCNRSGLVDKTATRSLGSGYVIGTAPLCGASCEEDCPGRECFSADPFSEENGRSCLNKFLTGKKCCCARNKANGGPAPPPAPPATITCSEFCVQGGYGAGVVIGKAPACGANCDDDCSNGMCSTSNSFFKDHGSACNFGKKVCCCAGNTAGPPSPLVAELSCDSFCKSAGWVRGDMDGTSPTCSKRRGAPQAIRAVKHRNLPIPRPTCALPCSDESRRPAASPCFLAAIVRCSLTAIH